jgi:hypothetical protein
MSFFASYSAPDNKKTLSLDKPIYFIVSFIILNFIITENLSKYIIKYIF